jgi:ribonucleoside-diphosphate reductase alpha chain
MSKTQQAKSDKTNWIAGIDYPEWGDNDLYFSTIVPYLDETETPKSAYRRLASQASTILRDKLNCSMENLEHRIYDILWNGWLIPSTPVMVNFGTTKGLPISCFSGVIPDDMYGIYHKNLEMAVLSKQGGGTAYDFSNVRPFGTPIQNGKLGTSDGIIPFIKSFDSTILACKQGRTRRGAVAMYLDVNHKEFESFLTIREPKGEVNRQCLNIHQGAVVDDVFMNKVIEKNGKERELWLEMLKVRQRTGEPYLFFIDNANKNNPASWASLGLKIRHSNLC